MMMEVVQEKLAEVGIEIDLKDLDRQALKGASDLDLVYTGIENIMSIAMQSIVKTANDKNITLRMAAYVNAIDRIYACYKSSGLTL